MRNRVATHIVSGARIQRENNDELILGPAATAWITPVLGSGLFTLIGVALLLGGRDTLFFGIIVLAVAVAFVTRHPLKARVVFDFLSRQVTFTADYLAHRPRHVEVRAPLTQIAQVGLRRSGLVRQHTAEMILADGSRIALEFGGRYAEAERFVERLRQLAGTEAAPMLNSPQAAAAAALTESQALMRRELQSWSIWLLILGVVQMVEAQGFSPWGALLIGVGLASFYFREASMFVVYAVTVGWAGLSNLLYGEGLWKGFALLQAFWTYQLFRRFSHFRRYESSAAETSATPQSAAGQGSTRAGRLFPWAALILGVMSLLVFGTAVAGIFLNVLFIESRTLELIFGTLETVAVYAGILGFATGLAAWVAAYPPKSAAVAGCAAGAMTLVIELGFGLFAG